MPTPVPTINSTALNTSGISCFLWDDSGHGDLSYFDRVNLTWFDSEVGKIFNELSGGGITPYNNKNCNFEKYDGPELEDDWKVCNSAVPEF